MNYQIMYADTVRVLTSISSKYSICLKSSSINVWLI